MPVDYPEIERIFNALENIDRKQDSIRVDAAEAKILSAVNASKVEDLTSRTSKLEKGADRHDEYADNQLTAIWNEINKLKDSAVKGKVLWALFMAGVLGAVEVAARLLFHTP